MRKSGSTVSNSPGALCRISSSVAGLIPGERTSATPRSVLQISDRHLRRYPIHIATLSSCSLSGDKANQCCRFWAHGPLGTCVTAVWVFHSSSFDFLSFFPSFLPFVRSVDHCRSSDKPSSLWLCIAENQPTKTFWSCNNRPHQSQK